MKRITRVIATLSCVLFMGPNARAEWRPWSEDAFEIARREKKLVILDLEAIWCHWCHVMNEKTYGNKEVAKLLAKDFISIRVDQDSRPDLARRYEDYGWPATIIFTPDGKEIVKRSGYIPAEEMSQLLRATVKDPSPVKQAEARPPKTDGSIAKLEALVDARYDREKGAWDIGNKFLDANLMEWLSSRAADGEAQARQRLEQTLDAQLALVDPVWGGVYQYSTGRGWKEPHFEKIMSIQADNIQAYSQASLFTGKATYLETAKKNAAYIERFLTSPDGAFYTSQDADIVRGKHSESYFKLGDAQRLKRGIPAVDKNVYARENGWMIRALTSLYAASAESTYLERAEKSAKWIKENRAIPGGGFRHGENDKTGPFLGDTLAMAEAFLRLYAVTGHRQYLVDAENAAKFMAVHFQAPGAGFSTVAPTKSVLGAEISPEENIQLARFANLLHQYTGRADLRDVARHAMRFVSVPAVAERYFVTAGFLVATREIAKAPAHVTLVAKKSDSQALALWRAALRYPLTYQRVDWWDKSEGALPKDDVKYPELSKPAVFTCTDKRCSLPAFSANDVANRIAGLIQTKGN